MLRNPVLRLGPLRQQPKTMNHIGELQTGGWTEVTRESPGLLHWNAFKNLWPKKWLSTDAANSHKSLGSGGSQNFGNFTYLLCFIDHFGTSDPCSTQQTCSVLKTWLTRNKLQKFNTHTLRNDRKASFAVRH